MTGLAVATRRAIARLEAAGVPSPQADVVSLTAHALGCDLAQARAAIILDHPVPAGFEALIERRAARIPLQHLTGVAGFRRLELLVGPGVFIPRPETEVVAEVAIGAARAAIERGTAHPVVVDLCTGSGAIALAVADEVPSARVHAVELSPLAYAYAVRNRGALRLPMDLVQADALTAFDELLGLVDVVVSNPPYIPDGATPLEPEVAEHDPALALYGGSADGLRLPIALAERAAQLLRGGGVLVMEHADVQGRSLPAALAAGRSWTGITDLPDLTGRPRIALAVRRGHETPE